MLALIFWYSHATAQPKTKVPADIYSANKLLSRTINIGFVIKEPQPGSILSPVKMSDIQKIKQAGFTAIRLPVDWISGTENKSPYLLDSGLLTIVDNIIQNILACNLAVVLDNHTDEQLMAEPAIYRERFLTLWRQLLSHFQYYPPQVMFELMAEPHGQLDNDWNDLLSVALKIVRSKNPDRPVIIGPVSSNRPQQINSLILPSDDRNIIVTFHQYAPIRFTMQGEAWFPVGKPMEWIGTRWPSGTQDKNAVTQLMDMVSDWAVRNKRPVFLGEFGVSANADTASAVRWIKFNREEAEKRGFSWGYWSTLGVHFSLLDPATGEWRNDYLRALMPEYSDPDINKKTDENESLNPAPGMTAELVLEKCINAMGGRKGIATIKDITLKGEALMSGTAVTIDQIFVIPGIFSESVSVNRNVYQHTIVKPGIVEVVLQGKRQETTAADLEILKEKMQPFPETLFLSNREYQLVLEGVVTEDNEDFYKIKVHSPLGREYVNYYSVRTALRKKTRGIQISPGDPFTETMYDDYQKIGTVILPRSVTNRSGQLSIEARFQISVNTGIVPGDVR